MADKISDYYNDWLAIPAGPRPPDHYALLGLQPAESDGKKIRQAAAARVRVVRQFASAFPKETADLLYQIAAAERCLLNADSKEQYDRAFAKQQSADLMWYLRRDNQVFGPFPDQKMREMVESGYVRAEDLVWNERLPEWAAPKTIAGLGFKPAKDENLSDSANNLTAHAQRFLPYQLRSTVITPPEKEKLTAANVVDRTEQMFLAWRRTMLIALAGVSLLAALWATAVTLLESEIFPPTWFGVAMRLVRTFALFALPAGAVAAALSWANQTWSRWLLIGGWLIATLTPLVIGLVPYHYLSYESEAAATGVLAGMLQFMRSLPIFASLSPAVIRAGLWLKSLRPASPVGAWSVAIAVGMHGIVYGILFVALNQMCGTALLFLVALLMIAAPFVYWIGYRWLLEPAGTDCHRRILTVRAAHLLIFAAGFALFVFFLLTRTFGLQGEIRLFGFSADNSLVRPGAALAMLLDFVARTFTTSIVMLDLFEQFHRALNADSNPDETQLNPIPSARPD